MATATKSPRKAPRSWAPRPKARRSCRGGGSKRGPAKGTSITHSCGHSQRHVLPSLKWRRDREQARQTQLVCTACWQQGKAHEVEVLCEGIDLPELTGTEAQVLWARTIRAMAISRAKSRAMAMDRERAAVGLEPAADRFMALALPPLLGKLSARWWIDNRTEEDALALLVPAIDLLELVALQAEASAMPECPF